MVDAAGQTLPTSGYTSLIQAHFLCFTLAVPGHAWTYQDRRIRLPRCYPERVTRIDGDRNGQAHSEGDRGNPARPDAARNPRRAHARLVSGRPAGTLWREVVGGPLPS